MTPDEEVINVNATHRSEVAGNEGLMNETDSSGTMVTVNSTGEQSKTKQRILPRKSVAGK